MIADMGTARVVRLTEGVPGPCFFLIPGTGGKIDGFLNLAQHFRGSIPVYAIEARGLDATSVPDTSVEDMVSHYLDCIAPIQAAGPYFLLGHSFGGLVALEMAQRLARANQKIACLIMLDTPTPEACWPWPFYLRSRWLKLRRRLLSASLSENIARYRKNLAMRGADLKHMPTDVMIGTNVARVLLAHTAAREAYRPEFYADKIVIFRPREASAGYETLWRNKVREMEILAADGNHLSMVEPPHAALLAARLSAVIEKALEMA